MQKKIAILLNNGIYNDARVIKVITTLSRFCTVHLYYINGDEKRDSKLFNDNVALFSVPHTETLKVKLLRHSLFCFEFNFFIKMVLRKRMKYDIIWANDLPTLYSAYRIANKLNVALVYDSHEIYIETINQFFPLKNNFFKQSVIKIIISVMKLHGKVIEKRLVPKTAHFITVNQSLLDYFKSKMDVPNGFVLMNLPLRKSNEGLIKRIDYREKFGWAQDSFILIYQGELNEGRGLKLLINSLCQSAENVKLVIVGNGVLKEDLRKQVGTVNLSDRVKFIDMVPLHLLPEYTRGADIGVNLLESINLSKKMASPNKLFEYIHAGIPVICSNTTENKRVLDVYKVGYLVDNSVECITETINVVSKSSGEEFASDLEKAKSKYCWENQEDVLSCIVK